LCGARLIVVAYIVAGCVRHYKLRCLACQRLSRTSLAQRLLDYATLAQAPAARSASASEPGFFCERCGGTGVETHHWAPRSLSPDYDTWPTAQFACHTLWHDVKHAEACRL
jgi:hypothetical protein